MMRLIVFTTALWLVFVGAHNASADGVYVPKIDPASHTRDISEPEQKAVILHQNRTERLILQVSYKGDVSEFVWLVPTPSKPEVVQYDEPIFHHLHWVTAPRLRYWFDAGYHLQAGLTHKYAKGIPATGPQVELLERKLVGVYDIAVLRATNEDELLAWLRKNGYDVNPRLSPVLADYIRRGWVFTAVRIDLQYQKRSAAALREGVLQSIQFKFSTPKMIYPLKISSFNPGRTKILLYIVSNHRMTTPSLQPECVISRRFFEYDSKYVGSRNFRHMQRLERVYHSLGVNGNKLYVSKLTGSFRGTQMTDDIVLRPVRTDDPLPPKNISPPFFENLGAVILLFIIGMMVPPYSLAVFGICLVVGLTPVIRRRGWSPALIAAGVLLVIVGPLFGIFMQEVFMFGDYWIAAGLGLVAVASGAVVLVWRRLHRCAKSGNR